MILDVKNGEKIAHHFHENFAITSLPNGSYMVRYISPDNTERALSRRDLSATHAAAMDAARDLCLKIKGGEIKLGSLILAIQLATPTSVSGVENPNYYQLAAQRIFDQHFQPTP